MCFFRFIFNLALVESNLIIYYFQVGPKLKPEQVTVFEKCLSAIADVFIKEESRINELDTLSGDGDAGSTLKRFADCNIIN